MRVPRKEYARSRHQRLFEENVGKTGKDAIYELFSERFGSCIYARGSKIGEVVAALLAQASSARPGEPGCFLQKQQPSGGIFWRAQELTSLVIPLQLEQPLRNSGILHSTLFFGCILDYGDEPIDDDIGDRIEDMIRDLEQDCFEQAHAPLFGWSDKNFHKVVNDVSFGELERKICVYWYLPIMPRFKRLSANGHTKNLTWHANGRKSDELLRHPTDFPQWKTIDCLYPYFGDKPRNLRLALASDEMNPFAYGNLSGYSVKGHHACPICERNTSFIQLKHGKKTIYTKHRRFLKPFHLYRRLKKAFNGSRENESLPQPLAGNEVYDRVKDIVTIFEKTQKKTSTETNIWKKRSIFFYLPYWSNLHARQRMVRNGNTKAIASDITRSANISAPSMPHNVNNKEDNFLSMSAEYKVPQGYSSNIKILVALNDLKLVGLKSHYCHVLMQQLLAVAIWGILPDKVRVAITRLCFLFNAICSKVIDPQQLDDLENEAAIVLCQLEIVSDNNPIQASMSYFGVIEEIWELDYIQFRVPVFKCKWVNGTTGVHREQLGFTLVDLNKVGYKDKPFINKSDRVMATPLRSPSHSDGHSEVTPKKTRQSTRLRSEQKQDPSIKYGIDQQNPCLADSLQEQTTQGSFVPHGRDDILNTVIGRPEHTGRVRVAGSDIQALGACVSTKGSNVETDVNPSGEEHYGRVIPTMGLYVQRENCTVLAALGKICEGGSSIHSMAYADDMESHLSPKKLPEPLQRTNNVSEDDPLRQLMDEWSSSLGHGSMYGFLEPQLIHHAKDRRAECEHYIQTWVKESQQEELSADSSKQVKLRFLAGVVPGKSPCLILPLFVMVYMEKLARAQYLKNKITKDCALLYIALNKVQLFAGIFKISKDEKDKPLVGFLSRNFQDEKNKVVALKNACLGKHQLELAIGFFLLGGDQLESWG
ncbi:hypothetical protein D0Y65_021898 [Glycine soja]|uniref:DUF4216 domain-containing protein n=1 Tax=Glycine soja TaxID=3848 RepID=A0A445JL77_GLYSO|nr:hypothetical protein D0Y65_021898 [Glycine soja]